MTEPLLVGLSINIVQLVALFVAAIFAVITAAVIVAVFLIGYLAFVTYLYGFYSKSGPFYAAIQLIIMSALVFIIVGIVGGSQAMITFGLLFVLPAVLVYLLTLYAPLKIKTIISSDVD